MNISNPTSFSPPDLTLTTSNSSGNAGALRADDSILVYDTTVPTNLGVGDSAATGSAATSARRDHVHGGGAVLAVATQAKMESATSTTTTVTPGRTQYHPGVSKAWCKIDGGGSLVSGSYNVSSVTDHATGNRTVVFNNDFADANFIGVVGVWDTSSGVDDGNVCPIFQNPAVGSSQVSIRQDTSLADIPTCQSYFGDQ